MSARSTPRASDVDVHQLPNRLIPRPMYPLDEIGDWRQGAPMHGCSVR